ncbi:MAG TPA: LacI family DNA-binding transcriptional regulator [Actinocatenispora sp.]
MPATIRDVAREAGVHVSTVSRAFSAPGMVGPDTRRRVLAVSARLGYRPNPAARALITGRTHNIGLIVADIANPFFAPLIRSAQRQARARGYHIFVGDTDEDPDTEQELVRALAKQVDGVVLCSPRLPNRDIVALCEETPLVVVNRLVRGVPSVLMDVATGARTAIDHLADLGHREIALLSGPHASWTSRQIRRAASRTAERRGARLTVLGPNPPTEDGGRRQAGPVVEAGASAVLAYNDLMALGLIEGLDELGVDVPGRVSVVGFDDIALSRLTRPKLTTIANPVTAAGHAAVDLLLQQPDTGAGASLMLPTDLVVRRSTSAGPHTSTGTGGRR